MHSIQIYCFKPYWRQEGGKVSNGEANSQALSNFTGLTSGCRFIDGCPKIRSSSASLQFFQCELTVMSAVEFQAQASDNTPSQVFVPPPEPTPWLLCLPTNILGTKTLQKSINQCEQCESERSLYAVLFFFLVT